MHDPDERNSRNSRSGVRRSYLLFIALVITAGCGSTEQASQIWPNVLAHDVAGTEISSGDLFEFRTTVVTLWSTTCVPCRIELPQLQAFAAKHPEIDVLAVNLGDNPESVSAYAAEIGLTMPIAIDHEGRISAALGIASVPATLIVDSSGKVINTHLGEISATELAALVETSS
jgi:thiol-disulfide isomerase/thioredoxin